MPASVRLDARTERLIRRLAKWHGRTRSEVIRVAIELLAREAVATDARATAPSIYGRVAHVVGIADSGGANLSERTGDRFRNVLIDRPRGRRPR
jgi:hypothetical protein